MAFPVGPWVPVLMLALAELSQSAWSGRLPNVANGEAFWASSRDVPSLIAAGLAEIAPNGTVAPPVEPAYTAHGSPGFAAGTSNASHLRRHQPGPADRPELFSPAVHADRDRDRGDHLLPVHGERLEQRHDSHRIGHDPGDITPVGDPLVQARGALEIHAGHRTATLAA